MSAPWWDSDWKDRSGPEYRVHVGNLAWGTDERSLKDAFADHGPIGAEVSGFRSLFVAESLFVFNCGWICACYLVVF